MPQKNLSKVFCAIILHLLFANFVSVLHAQQYELVSRGERSGGSKRRECDDDMSYALQPGASCFPDHNQCIEHAKCKIEEKVCERDNGYFASQNKTCKPKQKFGEECHSKEECDADFICSSNAVCKCKGPKYVFDPLKQKCVVHSSPQELPNDAQQLPFLEGVYPLFHTQRLKKLLLHFEFVVHSSW